MAKDSLPDETDLERTLETPPGMDRGEFLEREAGRRQHARRIGKSYVSPQYRENAVSKNKTVEILYCHSTRQTLTVGPGHWFFHTGQWAHCASAGKMKDGEWYVQISFAPYGKQLPEGTAIFGSIEEVQKFVSEYFGVSVVKVKPTGFPTVENL